MNDPLFNQVVQYAREFATGRGLHTGERWVSDAQQDLYRSRGLIEFENPAVLKARLAIATNIFLAVCDPTYQIPAGRIQALKKVLKQNATTQERGRGMRR